MARIVVGVDRSEHAKRAVRRAVEEARLRGASLQVAYVAPERSMLADPVLMPSPPSAALEAAGHALIDELLDDVDIGDVEVERVVRIGNAARALCKVAEGAELVVVGSRGMGGFRGLMVGSVTQQVVAHAPCPILVVVPEDR